MPKIYTKVGDKGQTQLVGGQKVSKEDARIDAYGTIDELNSAIGWAAIELPGKTKVAAKDLVWLQNALFDLGSQLATLPADRAKFSLPPITTKHVERLEKAIDAMTKDLAPLKNFILPGGSEVAARMHLCRTIARRAERAMVRLGQELPENSVPFINRVSDYFFVLARYCNHLQGVEDVIWTKSAE